MFSTGLVWTFIGIFWVWVCVSTCTTCSPYDEETEQTDLSYFSKLSFGLFVGSPSLSNYLISLDEGFLLSPSEIEDTEDFYDFGCWCSVGFVYAFSRK